MPRITELDHVRQGASILAACIVRTLAESDPALRERILDRLDQAFGVLRDGPALDLGHEMEMLVQTRDLVAG